MICVRATHLLEYRPHYYCHYTTSLLLWRVVRMLLFLPAWVLYPAGTLCRRMWQYLSGWQIAYWRLLLGTPADRVLVCPDWDSSLQPQSVSEYNMALKSNITVENGQTLQWNFAIWLNRQTCSVKQCKREAWCSLGKQHCMGSLTEIYYTFQLTLRYVFLIQ